MKFKEAIGRLQDSWLQTFNHFACTNQSFFCMAKSKDYPILFYFCMS